MIDRNVLWTEKWRPRTVKDCILPEGLKTVFQSYVDEKKFPNLLLAGSPGTGKTTVAKALCEETDFDYIMLNGSDENGIDVLRTKVKGFASSLSIAGARKAIIIDEADYLTPNAQAGFRGVIDESSKNCSFIFTCNYKNRLIEPLRSRCATIDFRLMNGQKQEMAISLLNRIEEILKAENVVYERAVVVELIKKFFPDYRRVLNEIQRFASTGPLTKEVLAHVTEVKINEVVGAMKKRDYNGIRKWVGINAEADTSKIFRDFFDRVTDIFTNETVAIAIVILGKYDYQSAFCRDQEINMAACLTELFIECGMK